MNKYTITQFSNDYPDDDACLEKIFQLRYSNLVCPKCESDKPFTRVKGRRSHQCPACGHQIYATQGTVFEKTTTPLVHWFFAIYLQTTTRNGLAAKELERQLSVCYKTALRMSHQIKKLMGNIKQDPLSGVVEVDEVYIGGLVKNKHKKDRTKDVNGHTTWINNKVGVVGCMSRDNKFRFEIMNGEKTIKDIVRSNVPTDVILVTDNFKPYRGLDKEYFQHVIINHSLDEFKKGEFHTNTLEGFWSQLKRTIRGTHVHVSAKHLDKYIGEVAFRYVNRHKQDSMFETILSHVVS